MPGTIEFDALRYGGEIVAGSSVTLVQAMFDGTLLPWTIVSDRPQPPPEGLLGVLSALITLYAPGGRVAVASASMSQSPTVPGLYYYTYVSKPTDEAGRWKARIIASTAGTTMQSVMQEAFTITARDYMA